MEKTQSLTVDNLHQLPLIRARYRNQRFARHTHDSFVVGVNFGGAHRSHFAGGDIMVPPGGVVLINPGEVHSGWRVSDEEWDYFGLYPSESAVSLAGFQASVRFRQSVVVDGDLTRQLRRAERATFGNESTMSPEEELLEVMRLVIDRYAVADGSRETAAPQQLRMAREFLHSNMDRNVTLGELARLTGLSRYHLLRSFRDTFGMTPHGYLMDLRIKRAQLLLRMGRSPGFVAPTIGFSDQSHLNRHFKKHLGLTPGQFARSPLV